MVYGAWPAEKPGTPTLLLYAHYDTQPTDPLNEWTTPPFEPTIRDGRMYARGASDDKGNLFLSLKVIEAYSTLYGRPPIGLIFLFEGEEEIGSPNLQACIQEHKERLHADVVMSADSVMWANDEPSLVLASKGLIALQIDVRGAESDLHSGLHGGLAPNPLNALTIMLGSMWTLDGQVQIEGFYDEVRPLSEQERAEIAAVPFDEASYARLPERHTPKSPVVSPPTRYRLMLLLPSKGISKRIVPLALPQLCSKLLARLPHLRSHQRIQFCALHVGCCMLPTAVIP